MYGEPWCFNPALGSITADGADSVMTALEALIGQILPQRTDYCFQCSSSLLPSLLSVCYPYYFLFPPAFFTLGHYFYFPYLGCQSRYAVN